MPKFRLPVQVCVFLFRERESRREYLLLHRVTRLGAFWQGVTGALEEGETLLQAAQREVLEETALTPAEIHSLEFSYRFPVADEWRELYAPDMNEIVEHVFIARVPGDDPTLSLEHDSWQWRTPKDAVAMLKWQDNIEALRRCESFLEAMKTLQHSPQERVETS